jgi:radical SAM protein with 4Fe4S-binding SPASM domain
MSGLLKYVIELYDSQSIPHGVLIELTHTCNLRCLHCYVPSYIREKTGNNLSVSSLKDVFRQLHDMGVLKATLSGGEPLMRYDWYEIACAVKEENLYLSLFTNATCIDEVNANRIASLMPLEVEVSVYGGSKEVYDLATGRSGAFKAFERGLRLLKERNVSVFLKVVTMRETVKAYEETLRYAESIGFPIRVRFDPQLLPKADGANMQRLTDEEMVNIFLAEGLQGFYPQPLNKCSIGKKGLVIGPEGSLRPCIGFPQTIGNILSDPIAETWRRSHILRSLRELRDEDFHKCIACEHNEFCMPCLVMNILETGSIVRPSPEHCRIAANRRAAYNMLRERRKENVSKGSKKD